MKKIYLILMAGIIALPIFISTVNADEDDWEAPNVIVSPSVDTDDIIIGGTDTATPTEDIIIRGQDTVNPTKGIIIGGWDSINNVFDPGAWGVQREGIFLPGGWGMAGMDIQPVSGEVPSGFGLWWRGVKEAVDLTFTFDAGEKAQKRLKYAEERMQMAGSLAGSNDPKAQKRIESLVGKAEKNMAKIEKTRDKWFDSDNKNSQQLVGNIVRHNLNRDAIMDRLESQLPEDGLGRIREVREQGLESSTRLMNALENENIPKAVKGHLQSVKKNIERQASEVKQYRIDKKDLLEKRKAGDQTADGRLKQLQAKRLEGVQNRVQQRQELGEPFFDAYRPNPTEGTASGLPTGKRQLQPEELNTIGDDAQIVPLRQGIESPLPR